MLVIPGRRCHTCEGPTRRELLRSGSIGLLGLNLANFLAFQNINEWTAKSGNQITIGAEQWPDCLNPITECANSSWAGWTTFFKVLPSVWDTTEDGSYVPTALVTGEPKVETTG